MTGMVCPSCRSEYRAGIVRCPTCDVPLRDPAAAKPRDAERGPQAPVEVEQIPMMQYCGFFSLDDARAAREQLRDAKIPSDILIRDAAPENADDKVAEEYWLRVPVGRMQKVEQILGFQADEAELAAETEEQDGEGEFACSDCGKPVAEHETSCSHCGARFDE